MSEQKWMHEKGCIAETMTGACSCGRSVGWTTPLVYPAPHPTEEARHE